MIDARYNHNPIVSGMSPLQSVSHVPGRSDLGRLGKQSPSNVSAVNPASGLCLGRLACCGALPDQLSRIIRRDPEDRRRKAASAARSVVPIRWLARETLLRKEAGASATFLGRRRRLRQDRALPSGGASRGRWSKSR
jgi:hypothetical protein